MGKLRGTPAGSKGGPKDPENPFSARIEQPARSDADELERTRGDRRRRRHLPVGDARLLEWASVAALASAKVKGVNQVLISRPPDVTDVTGVSIARGMPELSPYFSVDWK
jgi:hypothetical protein